MAKRRTPRPVVDATPTGQAVMHIDGALLSRGERGTWRIDLTVRAADGDRRRLPADRNERAALRDGKRQ